MDIKQKKEWAKLLYLKSDLNQKEIAVKVEVSEKTLSKWVNDEHDNWEVLKSSYIITREQELRRIYIQISELNKCISMRDDGQRYANSKEADILSKLGAAAKSLEHDASISETINVFKEFTEFVKEVDFAKAKDIVLLMDGFVKHKLSHS
jgi:transposase-like protein